MPDHRNRQRLHAGILAGSLLLGVISTALGQVGDRAVDEIGGRLRNPAGPEYDVIALRVEFQPDDSRFSTGDGVFGGSMFEGLEPRIDPFPHDAAYFEAHLDFLSNYVNHVSRGQTAVRTHLLPEIVRVSGVMGDYAPTGPDADGPTERQKLLNLVQEAWTLADEQISVDAVRFVPERTAFVIFHAGTGRDIELTGTVLDRTPEDLPSLYFGPGELADLDNPLTFNGIAVSNTALIPETESKRGVDPLSDEPFLLELSINGLVAASFFNYLGVPDLFNTSDGSSAIGPYGLMDALGIFAYGGLLPPEPSGWTRFYLGWTNPVQLAGPDEIETQLRAHVDQALVPVSSSEYFLVEVRHRDPGGDGLNLKVLRNGEIHDVHFDADADDFTSFDQSGVEGVLVDADDFDWVLPGGFDDTNTLRNGGILIWHVDEQVIAAGLPSNSVNVDPHHRGVDLEEADSAQDLGFPTANQFAPDFDRGTPFDFYFEGNPVASITATGEVALYANRFGPDTYPNSNSNGGGPSFVVLDNFTAAAATMGLRYRRPQASAVPIDLPTTSLAAPFEEGASVSRMHVEIGPARVERLLYHTGSGSNSLWSVPTSSGFSTRTPDVLGKPVVSRSPSGTDVLAFVTQSDAGEVGLVRFDPAPEVPDFFTPFPAAVRLAVPSTPLIGIEQGADVEYFTGFDLGGTGYVVAARSDLTTELLPFQGGGVVSLAAFPGGDLMVVGRNGAQVWNNGQSQTEWVFRNALSAGVGQVAIGRDALGFVGAVPSIDDDRLVILGDDGRVVEVNVSEPLSAWPILVDVDGDRLLEVVVSAGTTLYSFSREGAVTGGFPISLPAASHTQPLTLSLSGNDLQAVLLGLDNGYLYAYQLGNRPGIADGFPLAVGGALTVTPLISEGRMFSASASGELYGWSLDSIVGSTWAELYGGPLNQSYVELGEDMAPGDGVDRLIVSDETYNWPNPIRDGVTRLRVATREPSTVEISIIDFAGNLVHSLEAAVVVPHVPVEFEWRPDVQSGVYFARVSAETQGGRRDDKLYSIAVIR